MKPKYRVIVEYEIECEPQAIDREEHDMEDHVFQKFFTGLGYGQNKVWRVDPDKVRVNVEKI